MKAGTSARWLRHHITPDHEQERTFARVRVIGTYRAPLRLQDRFTRLGSVSRPGVRNLRWRRRLYAVRSSTGFSGYRVGSWQHALQTLLGPDPVCDLFGWVKAAVVAAGLIVVWGALVAAGSSPLLAAALAAGVVALIWVGAAAVLFVRDIARARAEPPPSWPGEAGVREPRRPPPSPQAGAIELDPPRSDVIGPD